MPDAVHDTVQPFQVERPGIRGRLVRLGDATLAPILAGGRYPVPVARLLAETLALAAALASALKYDGVFSLQLQGSGPVRLVVADVTSNGDVRAYARHDPAAVPPVVDHDQVVPRLLGSGHMAFSVDQGPDTDRYQGITELVGGSLNDCAHAYFRQSEQLQTAIQLCAAAMDASSQWRAASLMVQRLPSVLASEEAEDDWRRAVILMSSARPAELLDPRLAATDLLYRLFHEDGVRVYRPHSLRHHCRCSRHRVERTLAAFPLEELRTMIERGVLTVTCEFCGTRYVLTSDELMALGADG